MQTGKEKRSEAGLREVSRLPAGSPPPHTPLHSQRRRPCLSGPLALSRNDPPSALILSTAAREIRIFTHKSA